MTMFTQMWDIITKTGLRHVLYTYICYFFIFCALIHFFDSEVQNFGDAVWFGFNVVTTIGLGDITVKTVIGRLLTVMLSLYSIFIFALVPGVMTSWYLNQMEQKKNAALEGRTSLKDLTPQEKAAIAAKAKELRHKHVGH